jgi:hypothetical protein
VQVTRVLDAERPADVVLLVGDGEGQRAGLGQGSRGRPIRLDAPAQHRAVTVGAQQLEVAAYQIGVRDRVGVQEEDVLALRRTGPGVARRGTAAVLRVPFDTDRQLTEQRRHVRDRPRAGVVHEDDLEPVAGGSLLLQRRQCALQGAGLRVDRDDNRHYVFRPSPLV